MVLRTNKQFPSRASDEIPPDGKTCRFIAVPHESARENRLAGRDALHWESAANVKFRPPSKWGVGRENDDNVPPRYGATASKCNTKN